MERLTRKFFETQYITEINYIAIQKLGKLEDAEEELGVDLVKLLNNTHVKHILKSIVNDKKFHL